MQKIVVKEVELVHVVDLIIEDIHLIIIIDQDQDQDHYHHHIQEREKQDIMKVEVEVEEEEEIEVIQEIVIDINYDIYFIFYILKKYCIIFSFHFIYYFYTFSTYKIII